MTCNLPYPIITSVSEPCEKQPKRFRNSNGRLSIHSNLLCRLTLAKANQYYKSSLFYRHRNTVYMCGETQSPMRTVNSVIQ